MVLASDDAGGAAADPAAGPVSCNVAAAATASSERHDDAAVSFACEVDRVERGTPVAPKGRPDDPVAAAAASTAKPQLTTAATASTPSVKIRMLPSIQTTRQRAEESAVSRTLQHFKLSARPLPCAF